MDRNNHRQDASPLACWLLAAMLTVCALAVFALAGQRAEVPPSEAFHLFNGPRVQEFDALRREQATRVVMLGNSRLKYATWGEQALEEINDNEARAAILRMVNDWATFADFAPFVDAVLELRPDLVVMQIELLTQERSSGANLWRLRTNLKWRLFGSVGEVWNPGNVDQRDLQFATPCAKIEISPEAVEQRLERTGRWLTHDAAGMSSLAARKFIQELRRRGIEVALLAIPRSSVMEAARPEAELLGQALSEAERTNIWRYPQPVSDSDFCDTIHFNESGRRAFSAWLATEVLKRRAKTSR